MWNKISFDKKRYCFKDFTLKEWNNRRVSAAKKALLKEKEKAGLFPELMKFNSVEERIEQVDNMILGRVKQFRNDASKYIKTIISNGISKIVEVSKDEYWANLNRIDAKG